MNEKTPKKEKVDVFDLLPDELHITIFNLFDLFTLNLISLVSKKWKTLSSESILWKKFATVCCLPVPENKKITKEIFIKNKIIKEYFPLASGGPQLLVSLVEVIGKRLSINFKEAAKVTKEFNDSLNLGDKSSERKVEDIFKVVKIIYNLSAQITITFNIPFEHASYILRKFIKIFLKTPKQSTLLGMIRAIKNTESKPRIGDLFDTLQNTIYKIEEDARVINVKAMFDIMIEYLPAHKRGYKRFEYEELLVSLKEIYTSTLELSECWKVSKSIKNIASEFRKLEYSYICNFPEIPDVRYYYLNCDTTILAGILSLAASAIMVRKEKFEDWSILLKAILEKCGKKNNEKEILEILKQFTEGKTPSPSAASCTIL